MKWYPVLQITSDFEFFSKVIPFTNFDYVFCIRSAMDNSAIDSDIFEKVKELTNSLFALGTKRRPNHVLPLSIHNMACGGDMVKPAYSCVSIGPK